MRILLLRTPKPFRRFSFFRKALKRSLKGFTQISRACKGFTLIELLVVIAILAVLATIGVSVFTVVQKNARDGRTKQNIEIIARSIEGTKTIDGTSGAESYSYNGTKFANDFSIIPSSKNAYCIRSSNSLGNVISLTAADFAGLADPTTTCPGTWKTLASGEGWPSSNTYFNICTLLESGAVYCKGSANRNN